MKHKATCTECGLTESHWFVGGLCAKHYRRMKRRAMHAAECGVCGKAIDTSARYANPNRSYCSQECRNTHYRLARRTHEAGPCLVCGSVDPDRRPDVRYCGERCSRAAEHARASIPKAGDRCAKCGGPRVGRSKTKDLCQKCYKRGYLEANRPRHRAHTNTRRKRVQQATPPWADRPAIVDFYEACPAGMEVDHAIPLQGETASGLHTLANLQYLSIAANRAKSNAI